MKRAPFRFGRRPPWKARSSRTVSASSPTSLGSRAITTGLFFVGVPVEVRAAQVIGVLVVDDELLQQVRPARGRCERPHMLPWSSTATAAGHGLHESVPSGDDTSTARDGFASLIEASDRAAEEATLPQGFVPPVKIHLDRMVDDGWTPS